MTVNEMYTAASGELWPGDIVESWASGVRYTVTSVRFSEPGGIFEELCLNRWPDSKEIIFTRPDALFILRERFALTFKQ